jgi:hypothetical protein
LQRANVIGISPGIEPMMAPALDLFPIGGVECREGVLKHGFLGSIDHFLTVFHHFSIGIYMPSITEKAGKLIERVVRGKGEKRIET